MWIMTSGNLWFIEKEKTYEQINALKHLELTCRVQLLIVQGRDRLLHNYLPFRVERGKCFSYV